MILEIVNETGLEFALDGEWFRAGSWADVSSHRSLSAHATTLLEFSAGMEGVAGVVWWVDATRHNIYLSVVFTWPRLVGSPTFQCYAGLPPDHLKAELSSAPKLDAAGGSGLSCAWTLTTQGVRLQVLPDAQPFVAPTAADTALESVSLHREGNFWQQTRPKDATDGIVRGCKTIGTSVAGGCASAVMAPMIGAKQGGTFGFVKGLGVGVVGGLGMATVGTACGVVQVGRGILHSAEAHRARKEEKVWHQEQGQWIEVDLCSLEHALEIDDKEEEAGSTSATNSNAGTNVVDTEFYDLLGVRPDASGSEIKKAYYKQARQCHPDKNPGDEEATAKFQKMSTVYQVLSDPEARGKYDREGAAGVQDRVVVMDPKTFFSLLFGSERFIPWTGELHIATSLDHFSKTAGREDHGEEESFGNDGANGWALLKQQLKREVECACHLRDKLERRVYGRDTAGFEEQMRLEAHELARAQFGPELLVTLGNMYQLRAEMYLANELHGRYTLTKRVVASKHRRLRLEHRLSFLRSAAGSLLHARKVYRAASGVVRTSGESTDSEGHDEEQAKAVEEAMDAALPSFLGTAWSYVVQDIDATTKEVTKKFLRDKSVPWQIRIRRAQALQRLGQIFTEEGVRAEAMQNSEAGSTGRTPEERQAEAKAVIQEAFLGAMREK